MKFQFQKASKSQLRARVSMAGPAGSGKTYSALTFARTLVGQEGRIALIDTERGSASLYADRHQFDVLDFPPPYDPRHLVEAINAAAAAGYDALVIDSLSHFWSAEGGLLDIVDAAGGSFQKGWKSGTPIQNRMVDALLAFPGHVITTMRSKTEYVIEKGANGKEAPRKVGMAPVQRDGIEYEFTLAFDVDHEHNLHVSKSRCPEIATVGVYRAAEVQRAADTFAEWLTSGETPRVDAVAAKKRLFAAVQEAGWTNDAEAKAEALRLWNGAGFTGDRIDLTTFEQLLGDVTAKTPATDEDGFPADQWAINDDEEAVA